MTESKPREFCCALCYKDLVEQSAYEALKQEADLLAEALERARYGFSILSMLSERHMIKGGSVANLPNIHKNANESYEYMESCLERYKIKREGM